MAGEQSEPRGRTEPLPRTEGRRWARRRLITTPVTRWSWSALRPTVAWLLVVAGAVALLLGWLGVSGQALPAKQLPYLASGGLVGLALFILAGAFFAADEIRRRMARIRAVEAKVDTLYALLVAEAEPAAADGRPAGPVALPGTGISTYHVPECVLVAGKPAEPVSTAQIAARGLHACRLCDPAG